jgi:ubiquitin-protein ligase
MWNDQQARPAQPGGTDDDDALVDLDSGSSWSPEQLTRLEGEWRRLQRSFAFHPHVTVHPLRGDPPSVYQVDFRLNTLMIDDAGQLQYADAASVHIWLPPRFPQDPPLVRPLTGLFHPNVSWDGFHLQSAWHPGETLANLVRRMGDLLAWRIFDPDSVVNPAAMDWLHANPDSLPLDAQANFAPSAGGEPLAKIVRNGDRAIEGIRQSLLGMQAQLFSRSAPDQAAVRDFSLRTRLALDLFLERDIPDTLRTSAGELHDAARELLSSLALYDYLRGRRVRLEALRASARAALEAKSALLSEVKRVSAAVPAHEEPEALDWQDTTAVLRRIPEAAALQPFQLRLPKVIGEADRHLTAARSGLAALEREAPPREIPSDSFLGQKLEQEMAAVDTAAGEAKVEASDAVKLVEPAVARAREEADMVTRGRALERRLIDWGTEGVQAYFIKSGEEKFGPFQFEQMVQLDMQNVLVRSTMRGAVQVFDADTEMPLGKAAEGQVTVTIGAKRPEFDPEAEADALDKELESDAGGQGKEGGTAAQGEAGKVEKEPGAPPPLELDDGSPKPYPMTFELSERCDDLLVQLDFLRRQTEESVAKPDPAANASTSWCGQICRALSTAAARKQLRKEQFKVSQRWRFAMLDLAGLGPLKERLATYHLLARSTEKMPELRRVIKESRRGMKASEQRLAEIVRRSGRNVETNQLVIPPKFAQPYADELTYRKDTIRLLRKSSTLLKAMVIRLTRRLKDPKLLGRAGTPSLRVLPALPEAIEMLPMSDDDIGERIVELETLLHSPLGGPRPDPNRSKEPAAARPPVPVVAETEPEAEAGEEAADAVARQPEYEAVAEAPGEAVQDTSMEAAPAEHEAPVQTPQSEHAGGEHPEHVEEYVEAEGSDDFVVFDEPEEGADGHS